jgi:hypothetical protein
MAEPQTCVSLTLRLQTRDRLVALLDRKTEMLLVDNSKGIIAMPEMRIPVQEVNFEGHRARVDAIYGADGEGRYRFVKFEVIERKRPGRPPGKRRGRPPGSKSGRKPGRRAAEAKAAE